MGTTLGPQRHPVPALGDARRWFRLSRGTPAATHEQKDSDTPNQGDEGYQQDLTSCLDGPLTTFLQEVIGWAIDGTLPNWSAADASVAGLHVRLPREEHEKPQRPDHNHRDREDSSHPPPCRHEPQDRERAAPRSRRTGLFKGTSHHYSCGPATRSCPPGEDLLCAEPSGTVIECPTTA